MALTALAIKNLKPRAKLYMVADSGGLCIAVSPAGGKLWRFRYRLKGTQQIMGLGKWPEVSLEQARKLRDEAKATLAAGKHPTRERKAQRLRQAVAGENTFERVCRNWLELKSKRLSKKYAAQSLRRAELHVFPHIGELPIAEITIPDVVRVVEKVGARGTVETAHWVKQLMGQTFRYAAQRGMCQFNPAADMRDLLPATEEKHFPCIKPAEFPDLLRAMQEYNGDPLTVAALHLIALTFVRTSELIGAKWQEIDLNRAEWHIPKERMKMKRPHIVPLSKQAIAILKGLQPLTGDKEHVFHSQRGKKNKHISNGTILMALDRMGYRGRMTGHGYRALASSILYEKNFKPEWIERQLAHAENDKVVGAYNYHAEYLLERKKMMQAYADLLDSMRDSKGGNVFKMAPKGLQNG
jgi:integrase